MHWQQIGYQHERYVDENGRIVGDVEYRPGRNEVVATVRQPEFRGLGAYITVDKAKAAVERACASGVTAAPPKYPTVKIEDGELVEYDADQPDGEFYLVPVGVAPSLPLSMTDAEIDAVTRQQWGEQLGVMVQAHRAYARAILVASGVPPSDGSRDD